jgi:hypothetical protein
VSQRSATRKRSRTVICARESRPRQEVNDLLQQAEADFRAAPSTRLAKAISVLFCSTRGTTLRSSSETYFKQHVNGSAGQWFARAVEIDPNQEPPIGETRCGSRLCGSQFIG